MLQSLWPSSFCTCSPVAGFQSLTVLSSDADASSWPSGENATALIQSLWPSSFCTCSPVAGFQSLTVLSQDADASSWPSGENATALTQSLWPSSFCSSRLQAGGTFGNREIHGMGCSNVFLMTLRLGAKITAEEYI